MHELLSTRMAEISPGCPFRCVIAMVDDDDEGSEEEAGGREDAKYRSSCRWERNTWETRYCNQVYSFDEFETPS